jgi:hypothetical protein
MRKTFIGLVLSSIFGLFSAGSGTILAIRDHLPARFGNILHGGDVVQDFITFNGTALSAPLFLLLGQIVFTVLVFRSGKVGMAGVVGLTVLGVCYTFGQVGEPILVQSFNLANFDATLAVVLIANVVFPLMMVVFGVMEWRIRRKV